MRTRLLALAAMAAWPISLARAEVPIDGVYVTRCLPQATCSATIERKGPSTWSFDWTATDRAGQHTYCRYRGTLRLGDVAYRDEAMYGVLHGRLPGMHRDVVVSAMPGDQARMAIEENVCRKAKVLVGGTIVLNGFYDLEFGDY